MLKYSRNRNCDPIHKTYSDNINFWATDYRYLNDPYEIKYLYRCISQALAIYERAHHLPSKVGALEKIWGTWFSWEIRYIFSMSETIDNVSLWSRYADNGSGIAIAFDYQALCKRMIRYGPQSGLKKVNYIKEESLMDRFDSTLLHALYNELDSSKSPYEYSLQTISPGHISMNACYYKSCAYQDEQEWRIQTYRISPDKKDINFRERKGLIIPYLNLAIPIDCIKQIVVGPCANPLCIDAIGQMLTKYVSSYKIEILKSELPYINHG